MKIGKINNLGDMNISVSGKGLIYPNTSIQTEAYVSESLTWYPAYSTSNSDQDTIVASYTKAAYLVKNILHLYLNYTITSAVDQGTGYVIFNPPAGFDTSTNRWIPGIISDGGNDFSIIWSPEMGYIKYLSADQWYPLSTGTPINWAAGSSIYISGSYII